MNLPIGAYYGEAQAAQIKAIINARFNHLCKISRINVMRNQFHYLLIRSDPLISSIAFKKPKTIAGPNFDSDVQDLLREDEKFFFLINVVFFLNKCYSPISI